MRWKENKLMGILAGIVILVCLGYILFMFISQKVTQSEIRKKNWEKWKSKLIIDEQGRIIGARIDERN